MRDAPASFKELATFTVAAIAMSLWMVLCAMAFMAQTVRNQDARIKALETQLAAPK